MSYDLGSETDKNRMEFLRTEVATCLTLIGMAETEDSLHEDEAAARSFVHAEEGYATLVRFLSDPKHVNHITHAERQELAAGMEQIRAKLETLKR